MNAIRGVQSAMHRDADDRFSESFSDRIWIRGLSKVSAYGRGLLRAHVFAPIFHRFES